ncbi:hypothetical protein [Streptomyces sp. NPDC085479]|uniref:hypothetical protein n=1 Tax=Streptomyces sp. NPDC085479 TaxID=3365726 RepID=UPI0037D68B5D
MTLGIGPVAALGEDSAPQRESAAPQPVGELYAPQSRSTWTIEPGPAPAGLDTTSPTADVMPIVADRIYELGAEHGFARQQTDYQNRSISVLWKGTPPADVAKYAASSPFGVKVTIKSGAKYSRTEAEAARTRLLNSPEGAQITWSDLNDDGSGVTVGVAAQARTAVADAQLTELRETARIPDVTLKTGIAASVGYARGNDAPPWKGGIRTIHGGSACSSGFAVLSGSAGRLLSAGHCDTSGNGSVHDGGGQQIAPGAASVAYVKGIDSLLIDPASSPATAPRIYRGGYAATSTSLVKSWASNWPGDPVCSSGASTGEHCGTVYDDGDVVSINGASVGVIQVSAPAGSIMGGQGDSGGPMFKKVTGGVQARGILLGPDNTAGSQTYSCGTTDPRVGTISCSRWINYVPISTILNTWGVSLETG